MVFIRRCFTAFASDRFLTRLMLSKCIKDISHFPLPNTQKLLNYSDHTQLLQSGSQTYESLLILLCKRLQIFNGIPFGIMINPHWTTIWNSYANSLKILLEFTSQYQTEVASARQLKDFKITSENNESFVLILKRIMDIHHDNIVEINEGIKETAKYNNFNQKQFLNDHLKERILMQLICNNHISLSVKKEGIVNKNLNILTILNEAIQFVNDMSLLKYGEIPKYNIKSIFKAPNQFIFEDPATSDLIFPYIDNHIQYVLQELLKNSTRATIENNINKPIDILITVLQREDSSKILQVKISDHGLGIHPDLTSHLWDYSFTTVNSSNSESNDSSSVVNSKMIAGMGYGLPLSLTYCKLFGGDIRLQSIHKMGTDVYCQFHGF